MPFELIILTIFTFVVLVVVIGFGCFVRYSKVAPTGDGLPVFVGGRHPGGGFGGGGGVGGGGCDGGGGGGC